MDKKREDFMLLAVMILAKDMHAHTKYSLLGFSIIKLSPIAVVSCSPFSLNRQDSILPFKKNCCDPFAIINARLDITQQAAADCH